MTTLVGTLPEALAANTTIRGYLLFSVSTDRAPSPETHSPNLNAP